MTGSVQLLVLPAGTTDEFAQFYVLRNGTWHDVPLTTMPKLGGSKVREGVERNLREVGGRIGAGSGPIALAALHTKAVGYWDNLVPEGVRAAVAEALRESDGPPEILVHAHEGLEWIPWELLNDGTEWLAVSCRIARMPIVPNGPVGEAARHPVRNARSFLGREVIDAVDGADYTEWSGSLRAVEKAGGDLRLFPPHGAEDYPTIQDIKNADCADLIHITCHGALDESGEPCLRLDPEEDLFSNVDVGTARAMRFVPPGPLVFGNACSSAATAGGDQEVTITRGLGVAFFDRGASAFIGSIAPVGKVMALRFATVFYRHLLEDELAVGEALRLTKQDFAQHDAEDPSWLFYCLYGSPTSRFVPAATIAAPPP
ncbi:CHAT domain-containing protein [Kitasatospora camelliae]|uniref:CHAT domain-containing protein n=1 Tax=Kitasatospora camelliae TaxID=3156397 RepID=A0AAU8K5D2_9ACTN